MLFLKSTIVAIVACSAYALAAALPEPMPQCGNMGNSCDQYTPCCSDVQCDAQYGVVSIDITLER